jgi:hypothetical protein
MGIREKLRARVQPHLDPGESVEQAFVAVSGMNPYFMGFLGPLLMALLMKHRVVAVTDRRIVVFRAGAWTGTTVKEQLAQLPRSTRLGPVKGALWGKTEINGERVYVHRRFHGDVRQRLPKFPTGAVGSCRTRGRPI